MQIGILTFHAVYNYGAVLQSYALQKVIQDMGCDCELINYITDLQKDYTSLYSKRNGIKSFLKNIILLPYHNGRSDRISKFELFIKYRLKLSEETYKSEDELLKCVKLYDKFVVGSDQVWNVQKKSDVNAAYFLSFINTRDKDKIAYAPSLGQAEANELSEYLEYLEKFAFISCREDRGSKLLNTLLKKRIPVVLDPTLIVDKKYFEDIIPTSEENGEKYIFYYSLDGFSKRNNNLEILDFLSKKFALKVRLLTPEWCIHSPKYLNVINAGPENFLNLIKNASLVCTNSFHGMAMSIVFKKPFYVLEKYDGKDDRKRSLLNALELKHRIIDDIYKIRDLEDYSLDYAYTNKKLDELRGLSLDYLKQAIFYEEKCQ